MIPDMDKCPLHGCHPSVCGYRNYPNLHQVEMRTIILKKSVSDPDMNGERMDYNALQMTDSEALHRLLVQLDPGDEYTVKFTKSK